MKRLTITAAGLALLVLSGCNQAAETNNAVSNASDNVAAPAAAVDTNAVDANAVDANAVKPAADATAVATGDKPAADPAANEAAPGDKLE